MCYSCSILMEEDKELMNMCDTVLKTALQKFRERNVQSDPEIECVYNDMNFSYRPNRSIDSFNYLKDKVVTIGESTKNLVDLRQKYYSEIGKALSKSSRHTKRCTKQRSQRNDGDDSEEDRLGESINRENLMKRFRKTTEESINSDM